MYLSPAIIFSAKYFYLLTPYNLRLRNTSVYKKNLDIGSHKAYSH